MIWFGLVSRLGEWQVSFFWLDHVRPEKILTDGRLEQAQIEDATAKQAVELLGNVDGFVDLSLKHVETTIRLGLMQ